MTDEIKTCVDARINFFDLCVTVPDELQAAVGSFKEKTLALADSSSDAAEFEKRFCDSGLSESFNALVTRCTPKAHTMTKEEKAYSRGVAKEMLKEQRGEIAKDVVEDIAETVAMKAEGEAITQRNRRMADAGVLDEYTRATNAAEDIGGLFKRIFKKK